MYNGPPAGFHYLTPSCWTVNVSVQIFVMLYTVSYVIVYYVIGV